jgi:hypothetical protein
VVEMSSLPKDREAELAAFNQLSDEALWLLAKTTLSRAQQEELAWLNEAAQQRDLSMVEVERQDTLLDAYNRVIVRRAQAAVLLKERGHDIQVLISNKYA